MGITAANAQSMTGVFSLSRSATLAGIIPARPSNGATSAMDSGVLRLRHDLKVLDAIVRLVAIDVVNNLMGRKRSPEMLFHDMPMLVNSISVCIPDADIPIGHDVAARATISKVVASQRAVMSVASDMTGESDECYSAGFALKRDTTLGRPITVPAFLTTVLAVRGWRCLKLNSALTAGERVSLRGHRDQSSRCLAGDVTSIARLLHTRFPRPQANFTRLAVAS